MYITDRLNRQTIMIVSDVLRGLIVLNFIFINHADQLWLLYLIAFLQAAVGTLFGPARGALMAGILPKESLLAANSLNQTSTLILYQTGYAMAGVLLSLTEAFWLIFAVDAFTFFWSVAMVSRLVDLPRLEPPKARGKPSVIFGQLLEGLKLIVHNPILLGTVLALTVTLLGLGAIEVITLRLLTQELHVEATWLGPVFLAQALATILSSGFVLRLAHRLEPTRIITIGLFLLSLVVFMNAIVASLWQLFLVIFIAGLIIAPINASLPTIVQTRVANELRGRVGASFGTITSVAILLSLTLAGTLSDFIGVRQVFPTGWSGSADGGPDSGSLVLQARVQVFVKDMA